MFLFLQFSRLTDGQTDRRTDKSLVAKTAKHRCSAVKMIFRTKTISETICLKTN